MVQPLPSKFANLPPRELCCASPGQPSSNGRSTDGRPARIRRTFHRALACRSEHASPGSSKGQDNTLRRSSDNDGIFFTITYLRHRSRRAVGLTGCAGCGEYHEVGAGRDSRETADRRPTPVATLALRGIVESAEVLDMIEHHFLLPAGETQAPIEDGASPPVPQRVQLTLSEQRRLFPLSRKYEGWTLKASAKASTWPTVGFSSSPALIPQTSSSVRSPRLMRATSAFV